MNLKLKMFCNYRAKIWPHSPQQNYELSKLSKVLLFDDVSTRTRGNNKLETIKGVFEIQNLHMFQVHAWQLINSYIQRPVFIGGGGIISNFRKIKLWVCHHHQKNEKTTH